ncbi:MULTISPECIES: glycerate kinase family protein [Clostridium]|jgi:glycerate kinase|uniref:glycerate kinase family protein n=1 Tax=Clostridium TaxID=1485 RepID=UPI000BE2904E|nr:MULTISPECIES: glycerate kinase [Clostridium]MBP1867328.1 glycerate kinase [Clostridium tertium]MBU6134770.1 glycerate kinase [Clostridium tertium]MDB1940226.1 glycerate kinase [Clostridium tertium]MDB1948152.1 glycerate kinase [Clostridium tertium]MDI9216626.1 glycerate kinase [Clostridium tertium]
MKVVIAPDSYKGSLTAMEVANSIEEGIIKYNKNIEVVKVPMADGGEGTVQALVDATGGKIINLKVCDPLLREIDSFYGILGDGKTAIIEMAAASGLNLLHKNELNPLITSTYGTGQILNDAIEKGCRKIIVGLGGSATNDGGAGMLRALGIRFLNKEGRDIPEGGGVLKNLYKIDKKNFNTEILKCEIIVACDVDNTLCGINGATNVFGPQKGASEDDIRILDEGLSEYSKIIKREFGVDVLNVSGSGAAGGTGAAFLVIGAKLESGVDIVIRETNLVEALKDSDIVFTGEGRIDFQTKFGKAPYGVAKEAEKIGLPVIAICGEIGEGYDELYNHGFTSIFSIVNKPMTLEESIKDSKKLINDISERVIRLICEGDKYLDKN